MIKLCIIKNTHSTVQKKTPAAINDEAGGSKLSQLIIAPVDSRYFIIDGSRFICSIKTICL